MRIHYLAVPVFIYLAAPLAMAQSQPKPQSQPKLQPRSAAQDYPMVSDQSVSTVRVTAPPSAFDASPEQVDWISGAYRMSNGWRLDVQPAPNGIVAKIDKERPMRLVAVSDDRYVTTDGNVAMTFNRGAHGDEMLMSYVPRSNLAALVVARSSLARR